MDRGAGLLSTIQSLPALAGRYILDYDDPEYECDHSGSDNGMPWCSELAGLRSRSLTQLTVSMIGGPPEANTLRLVGMPELRDLSIYGLPGVPLHMRIDAESFAGAPRLQSLHIRDDEALNPEPGALSQLTALTSLRVLRCGLRSFPAADVASLSFTLVELDLSGNSVAIDAAAAACILQCGRLSTLALRSADVNHAEDKLGGDVKHRVMRQITEQGFYAVQLSLDSLKHLMQLPVAFYKRHGRELHVCVGEYIWWDTCRCFSKFYQ